MEKTTTTKTDKICTICGTKFKEFGNNAMPVKDGICCDKCNDDVVITARIREIELDRLFQKWAKA